MENLVDWVSVGEVSAERDSNLSNYFFDAGVSKAIIDSSKQYLLLGRKGAGKTAVFLHLASKPSNLFKTSDLVIPLSLQSYNWQAHELLADRQKAGGYQHRDSWRFVLYIESIRAIYIHCTENNLAISSEIKKAAKLLEKLFSKPVPTWTDLLGAKLYTLANFELPSLDLTGDGITAEAGSISFEQIEQQPQLRQKLNQNIANLTNWFESCLSTMPENLRIFLIFDRLDEAWVPNFLDESKTIISGLLHASEHVLGKFKGAIRPIVFLREDIFWTFDINDRNKLREDCSESLRWKSESIEKLILSRINFFAASANHSPIESLLDLFQEKEMRSRTNPVRHLFNRTMCRPRDMVAFLSRTLKSAKSENYISTETGKILTKAIYEAEPGYSDYLYDELSDEWRNQNPNFLQYLAVIENLRYAMFSTSSFEDALKAKDLAKDRAEFRAVLRFLFDNSIIGIQVGESTQWRYKCFLPTQAFTDVETLKVHPGLIKRLGLTEGVAPGSTSLPLEFDQ
ncbi:P-loop ATPase, Sll1717 family [Polaromonas sp.]|uniref:P-loop ATPase, Sll1717 family n=1 Tax=Polaromonas sp. TaxID=1869339 RepID=UPI003BB7D878